MHNDLTDSDFKEFVLLTSMYFLAIEHFPVPKYHN